MSTVHTWRESFLFAGAEPNKKHPKGLPPVPGWVTCAWCGAQVCQQGYGKKATLYWRASARHEWTSLTEPACLCPTCGTTLPSSEEPKEMKR